MTRWHAACFIRGAKDAPKYKGCILPLVFARRLCDVFDNEVNRIAQEVGGRAKAFKLVARAKKLVRFYIPLQPANADEPVWSIIRKLADQIGAQLTMRLRAIKNKWASYTRRTHLLIFNTELLDLDEDLGDYVIVYELLHFRVPNHGKSWKSLMHTHLGDYEEREKRLKRIAPKTER